MANHAISTSNVVRLVPALIGRPGRTQIVHIPCPTDWCVLDHANDRQVAVEDVSHRGDVDHIEIPTMGDDLYSAFEIYSQLYADPASRDPRMRIATVVVTDGSNDAYLTPDMADEVADELIKKAAQIRQKARIARRANAAAVGSEHEAVRRSVDAQFPNVAEFLAKERGAGE